MNSRFSLTQRIHYIYIYKPICVHVSIHVARACRSEAWKTQIAYSLGQLNDADVSASLGRAIDVTTFKYGVKVDDRGNEKNEKP